MTEASEPLSPDEVRRRRRRLEEIFGDVVPDQVSEEVDSARDRRRSGEDWLKEQVPPHHG